MPPGVCRGSVRSRRASGGPVGTPWRAGGSVHQSCIDTGQSSDPSSPDVSRRAKTGFRRKPVGTQPYGTLTYPDGTQQAQPNPSSLTPDWVRQRATRKHWRSTTPLLTRAPRDEIAACDQVLHSDVGQACLSLFLIVPSQLTHCWHEQHPEGRRSRQIPPLLPWLCCVNLVLL